MIKLLLNERINGFKKKVWDLKKESLISGREKMQTYLIKSPSFQVKELLRESRIFYLSKRTTAGENIMFELFDDKTEVKQQLEELSKQSLRAIEVVPDDFKDLIANEVVSQQFDGRKRDNYRRNNSSGGYGGRDENRNRDRSSVFTSRGREDYGDGRNYQRRRRPDQE